MRILQSFANAKCWTYLGSADDGAIEVSEAVQFEHASIGGSGNTAIPSGTGRLGIIHHGLAPCSAYRS